MTKLCNSCNLEKEITSFSVKKRYHLGVYCWCKECVNKYNKKRRNLNPNKYRNIDKKSYYNNVEKRRQKSRGFRFKQKYWPNLSYKEALLEWDKLYSHQSGLCSVCNKAKPLDVEHDHSTGIVRSLACNDCNTAIARVREDINTAKGLVEYLIRWKS